MLLVNPRTDLEFAAFAREEMAAHSEVDPAVLESRLRERYPDATIHVRALSNEPITVWYLYRDGHWTPPE